MTYYRICRYAKGNNISIIPSSFKKLINLSTLQALFIYHNNIIKKINNQFAKNQLNN